MKRQFSVTYEIVTAESAEHGEAEERGYVITEEDGYSLRECIAELFKTRTNAVDGIECIYGQCGHWGAWLTVCNSSEFETGARESRALHLPPRITLASQKRLFKLLGAA